MAGLLGWAFAAFWAARLLLYGVPVWLLDTGATVGLSPTGVASMGGDRHPWAGCVALLAAGWLLREKGPLLWMAGGVAMAAGPRPGWESVAGAAVFLLGAFRSGMGPVPLILAVLVPQILLRESLRVWPAALLLMGGMGLIGLVSFRRPRFAAPEWRWWPGVLASALLFAVGSLGNRFSVPSPPLDPAAPYRMDFFQKGVSFTAEGVRYDSAEARAMLGKLPAFGVDSIALIPYGFSRRGEVRIRIPGHSESWESQDGMGLLAAEAHRLGMRVMIKPHVWRLQGRSPIPEAEARQWLQEYRPFIVHYARFAARIHADLFCAGTELRGLTGFEQEWREILADIRREYRGPVVYAANHGEEFESIRFWDALDWIGIDNYYPLDDHYSAEAVVEKIEAVQRQYQKPVLFTEAGFGAHENAHREPWEDKSSKPLDLAEQARSYEALLSAVYRKPWFRGVYWWKIGTNGYGGPGDNSMTPWEKPAMDVLKRFYLLH